MEMHLHARDAAKVQLGSVGFKMTLRTHKFESDGCSCSLCFCFCFWLFLLLFLLVMTVGDGLLCKGKMGRSKM